MQERDPCVWTLVKEAAHGHELQVLVLFDIDDFMLTGRKGEVGWEEFQQKMHDKWKWSECEQGRLRVTGVDVSQLCDGSSLMDQRHAWTSSILLQSNPRDGRRQKLE